MIIGVGVPTVLWIVNICYLYVNCKIDHLGLGRESYLFLLLFNCNYVVSVRRGFLCVHVINCVDLLWHSLAVSQVSDRWPFDLLVYVFYTLDCLRTYYNISLS